MLKLTHVQARLTVRSGRASVTQMQMSNADDARRIADVLALYKDSIGCTRDEIGTKLVRLAGHRLDYRDIDALAKVVADSYATFEPDPLPDGIQTETRRGGDRTDEEIKAPDSEVQDKTGLSGLSAVRLAVWRAAAQPGTYPFGAPGLAASLAVGEVCRLDLLPDHKRRSIVQAGAATCDVTLDDTAADAMVARLYADLSGRARLMALSPDLSPDALLNRYNVELLRGVLYLAPRMTITVRDKYKDLFKYIKLFGLMHNVTPLADEEGYIIELEGASSPFLAASDRRYGIGFATFLPALLLCKATWTLETELVWAVEGDTKLKKAAYSLSPQPHLRSHFRDSGEFDSLLEADLAARLEEKITLAEQKRTERHTAAEREDTERAAAGKKPRVRKEVADGWQGWHLRREDRIVPVFDTVMIPDFSFVHDDGRRALFEIVGFWEKGYLERKIAKLNRAGRADFIVLVSERTRVGRDHFVNKGQEPPYQLIFFKGVPVLSDILTALERCAR